MTKRLLKGLSLFLCFVMLFSLTTGLTFTAQAATEINSITIQEVVLPRPGATPSENWSKTGVSWKSDAIKWYEVPSEGYDIPLSSDTKFIAGKNYKVSFVAWAESGYDFAPVDSINATIDGFKATVAQYLGRDTKRVVLVSYIFKCEYKKVTNVTLTCKTFEKGTELTSDFFYAQGEGVSSECVSTFTRNGVAVSLGETVTFGDYGANVVLAPLENYEIADDVVVKLGENTFKVAFKIGTGVIVKSEDNLWHIDCDHVLGDYENDVTTHWKTCSACGEKSDVDAHDFVKTTVAGDTVYTCSDCGYVKTEKNKVDDFIYADVAGGVQIIAYRGAETNLNVPATLADKKVVSIGDYAFANSGNRTTFTSITIPTSVTSLGRGAFNGCTSLSSVNIPADVKRIEAETFLGCTELKNINIPYGVTFIGESAFWGCGISSIIIPCSVKTIKSNAFRSCENLGNVVVPDSVTTLYLGAFVQCSSLKSVVIGKGINTIAQATFDGCNAIETLTLPVELTTINKYNFDLGCVKTVNYRGTEEEFNAINITNNTDLTSATKVYNYDVKPDIGQHKYIVAQTIEPTCVSEGYTVNMCEGCGDAFTSDVTPATGVHAYNSGAISIEPTCISAGVKTYLCKDCGISKTETVVKSDVHTYGDAVVVNATCTKEGSKTYTCVLCKNIYSEKIPVIAHKEVTIAGKDATCTETGLTEGKKCEVCGKVTVAQEEIPVIAHKEVAVAGKDATCTETGLTEGKKCEVCGKVTVAQEEIPVGHKEIVVAKKVATYFASGYTGDTVCVKCSKITVKGKAIAKLKLKAPKFSVIKGKKQFKVKYIKVKDATKFQVRYRIKGKWKIKTFKAKKNVTKIIKKLKKGTYKVQVRAMVVKGKQKAYSAWSKQQKVKVK